MKSTRPVAEVKVGDLISLMTELEVASFIGFTPFQRARYLKRIKDAAKRSADVATLDNKFLTWDEWRKPNE